MLLSLFVVATIFLIVGICIRRFVLDDGTDPGGFCILIGLLGYLVAFFYSLMFFGIYAIDELYGEEVDAIVSQIYGE